MDVTGLYLSGDLPRISHNLLCLPRSLGVLLHYIIAITLTSELMLFLSWAVHIHIRAHSLSVMI